MVGEAPVVPRLGDQEGVLQSNTITGKHAIEVETFFVGWWPSLSSRYLLLGF
jgi:hypothetical protein